MPSRRLLAGLSKAIAVVVMVTWSIFPIGFIVLSSLKPGREIFAVPPKLFSRRR